MQRHIMGVHGPRALAMLCINARLYMRSSAQEEASRGAERSERTKSRHCTHRAFSCNRRHRRTCSEVQQSYLKLLSLKASRKTRMQG